MEMYKSGWVVNVIGFFETDFTPPKSLEDLINSPSETMRQSWPPSFPTEADAMQVLMSRVEFLISDYNRHEKYWVGASDDKLRKYFKAKGEYLKACAEILGLDF